MFVTVPATTEGRAVISELTAQGISVNVTLIFSLERYRQVIDTYLTGLEKAADAEFDLSTIHSVGSFFVSRVDTAIDAQLTKMGTEQALNLRGCAAIANARLAYEIFEHTLASERSQAQVARRHGQACPQRPLWASTGVKNWS